MSRQFLEIFTVAAIWLASGLVAAEPTAVSQHDYQAQARAYLKEGLAAQKEGRHEEAIRRFNLAYSLAPHPRSCSTSARPIACWATRRRHTATTESASSPTAAGGSPGRPRCGRACSTRSSSPRRRRWPSSGASWSCAQAEAARQQEEQRRLDAARAIEDAKLAARNRRAEQLRAMQAEKLQNERRALARIAGDTPLRRRRRAA